MAKIVKIFLFCCVRVLKSGVILRGPAILARLSRKNYSCLRSRIAGFVFVLCWLASLMGYRPTLLLCLARLLFYLGELGCFLQKTFLYFISFTLELIFLILVKGKVNL